MTWKRYYMKCGAWSQVSKRTSPKLRLRPRLRMLRLRHRVLLLSERCWTTAPCVLTNHMWEEVGSSVLSARQPLTRKKILVLQARMKSKGQTSNGDRKGRGATQKGHLRSKPLISWGHRQEINREEGSSVSTDLNSKVSSRCDFDEVSDDVNVFAIPLHSSSPKRVDIASSDAVSERSQTFDRPLSLSSSSIHSDHSDVTSLLMDRSTSTADTVISRDILNAARSWKQKSSALSVTSNQSTSSEMSGVAPLPNGKSRYLPLSENEGRRNLDSESARRKYVRQKQEDFISRKESDRILTAGDMLVAIFSVNMWRSIKAYLDPFILNLELSMFARRSDATLLFMNKQTVAGTNRCKITWFTYHMAHISILAIRE